MTDYFIQNAIGRKGRVRRYLHETYGNAAFTQKNTIRDEYLDKAELRARKEGNISLERAIILAKRLKGFARNKIKNPA